MTKNRAAYFDALGLGVPRGKPNSAGKAITGTSAISGDPDRDARLAALTRSHEIRKFEIELYWKRATYFWVLQGAVFAALGLIWKGDDTAPPFILPVALAALGLLTAAAGWFSAQGSKFWQENWERHIDMLEDEFEGKLHKTAWVGLRGVRWSVSNINDRLILFFVVFWLLVFAVVCFDAVPAWSIVPSTSLAHADFRQPVVLAAGLVTFIFVALLYHQKTDLSGSIPDWEADSQLAAVQPQRASLFWKTHQAPFIVKRGQSE